jgi:branched-chain amino acid aminotransferase
MTTPAPRYAWQNGRLIPWDQCVLHARSQGAFWGANVFEGLRAYRDELTEELLIFRMADHLARLGRSMKSLHMQIDHDTDELAQAACELLRANGYRSDVHLCVVAYFDTAPDFDPLCHTTSTGVHITATPVSRSPGYGRGVSASISTWRRISDDTMPPRIKAGANYHNSRLAQHEATRNGYDTTLLLNQRGHVSEAPGSCVVMVRDGELVTPPGTSGALEGITVATAAALAEDELGLSLGRRDIDRTELYVADELFLCGTRSELLPITSVDRIPVGDGLPGPVTRKLQALYDDAVRGRGPRPEWCTTVADLPATVATR